MSARVNIIVTKKLDAGITDCKFVFDTDDETGEALAMALNELVSARAKFPTWPQDPLHAKTVLDEELGEFTREALMHIYEPDRTSRHKVRKELIQTAAMALRLLANMDKYVWEKSPQIVG